MEIVDVYGLPSSAEDDGLPSSTQSEPDALASLRTEIEALDRRLVHTLIERFRLVQAISEITVPHALSLDPAGEAHIVKRATRAARNAGVPEEGVRAVVWAVLGYCREGLAAAGPPEAACRTATGGS
ncbi:MAG: chorismate mutase [Longimicrobiales bacterium]|nr:chorismate mutase [Longimicrobiales bacterium]